MHIEGAMMDRKFYTKFEKTRILSARALQIAQGSPVLIKVPAGMTDPIKIAELEWEHNLIPIDILKEEKKIASSI